MFDSLLKSLLISRSRVINAPIGDVFNTLADPTMHSLIDGSGTVFHPVEGAPERLSKGATFGMRMKVGVEYKITNTVVEFEEPTRIAWRHVGGHIWRYELRSIDPGSTGEVSTEVTETFDGRRSKFPPMLILAGYTRRHPKAMELTLERLAGLYEK
jgi:uncharacterized protein YndB with AHSA1/START domain